MLSATFRDAILIRRSRSASWPVDASPIGQVLPYIVAQVLGGICAAYILFAIASGAPGFDLSQGFAANGFGDHSPGKYTLLSGFLSEVILTMMFVFIIMGATHGKAPVGFAPIAIGLGLTLIHLIGIPVTNVSVNPARSTGPALVVGGWALQQLWLFWLAPFSAALRAAFSTGSSSTSPRRKSWVLMRTV